MRREGGREGGRNRGRDEGREGGREEQREGRREGGREGERESINNNYITCTPISHSDLHWSLISTKLEESMKCESGSFIAVMRSDLNN